MATVQLTQGLLNYRRDGRGPVLVLLSASPGEHRDFDAVFSALAAHFDVIAPDWPGYGASTPFAEPAAASAMAFYEVLVEFLAALQLPQVLLLGNSVGGYAAARLAIEQPARVEKIVLVSPKVAVLLTMTSGFIGPFASDPLTTIAPPSIVVVPL